MAIFVQTETPSKLVREIKEYIDDKNITTWMYDKDGDFTHDTDQWRFTAWIRPSIEKTGLFLVYYVEKIEIFLLLIMPYIMVDL